MTSTSLLEALAGLLLVFFLPGYTTTRAIFPEWRIRGTEAWRRGVEIVTLSFVLSIGWTVVLGYLLLAGAPNGFEASWTDPELEVALLVVSVAAFIAGWRLDAYSKTPPASERPSPDPGGEGAWELTRHLDRLARDERRLEHALRAAHRSGADAADLERQLSTLREESSRLRQDRERQYAQ
ncbi:MAG: DUF1616 domain-containing protein [Thermoplasmata archaeon]